MAKFSNSIRPNLLTCTVLEAHQNYHGYIVKVNVKNSGPYDDLRYSSTVILFAMIYRDNKFQYRPALLHTQT